MSSFCSAKATHIFSVNNINLFTIFQDRNFNVTLANIICRNSRTTGTNPHQSVPSVTSQPVASSQTGNSVEMYRII